MTKSADLREAEVSKILENLDRPIALIGMMGSGKSHIGRKLADRMGLPFVDSDRHIEAAAGSTVGEIFTRDGEALFRAAERRVISDLLNGEIKVIATGGGAIMNSDTAADIKEKAVSIWLRADIETLVKRLGNAHTRPMLAHKDIRQTLKDLMHQREPVYKQADITVDSVDGSVNVAVDEIITALTERLG